MNLGGPADFERFRAARPGVERILVWTFLGIRAVALAQAAAALSTGGLSRSADPLLSAGLLSLEIAWSLVLGWWLVRRRSMLPFRWPIAVDFIFSVGVVAASAAYIAPTGRINTWTMWAYPVTLTAGLLAAASLTRAAQVLSVACGLAITYVAVVALPLLSNAADRVTAVVNALAFPGFAGVAYLFTRFVRDLANEADTAKRRVSELEKERSRALIHDLLVYLRLDRFAEADDQARAAMITQAQAKHDQMRSYVDGIGDGSSVQERVAAVLRLHPSLTIRSDIGVGQDLRLPEDSLEQLDRALDTALANVEQHASGASVTLSVRSEPHQLSVTVSDDGPGFDPTSTPRGFGISEVLGRQLHMVGGASSVMSNPGQGTTVIITIPRGQE